MKQNGWGGNRIVNEQTLNRLITQNHYKWCKKNKRDTSWYKNEKKGKKRNIKIK